MNIDCSSEFLFQTSRSSGPGGQNVNKVNTKVELLFHIEQSQFFTTEQKLLLQTKLSNKISADGYLHIVSQTERSQLANKEKCVEKFYAVIAKALFVAKKRKATKPTYTSKLERLDSKRNKSEIKNLRKKPEL